MPGLPEAIIDALTAEALACARAEQPAGIASVRIAAVAQGNETALRLARVRLLGRASRVADEKIWRRAADYVTGALAG